DERVIQERRQPKPLVHHVAERLPHGAARLVEGIPFKVTLLRSTRKSLESWHWHVRHTEKMRINWMISDRRTRQSPIKELCLRDDVPRGCVQSIRSEESRHRDDPCASGARAWR